MHSIAKTITDGIDSNLTAGSGYHYSTGDMKADVAIGSAALLAALAGFIGKQIYNKINGSGFNDFVKNFSINSLLTNNKLLPELHLVDVGTNGKLLKIHSQGLLRK